MRLVVCLVDKLDGVVFSRGSVADVASWYRCWAEDDSDTGSCGAGVKEIYAGKVNRNGSQHFDKNYLNKSIDNKVKVQQ